MGLLFPDPPTPPNPILTSGLQTAQNVGTAVTGSYLNNYNQVTPQGNLTYEPTSTYRYNDPVTGVGYDIPRWTATQTPAPAGTTEGDIRLAGDASRYNQAQLGKDLSYNLWNTLGNGDALRNTYNAAPAAGEALRNFAMPQAMIDQFGETGQIQRNIGDPGQQQSTFGDAGAITRDYGPADNFSADRARVEQSLFQRMDPQLQQDRERLRQQLADQGIQYGTEAYDRAIAAADRQTTDARLAVTAAGGAEQQRMNDMAAQRAGFQNAAQKQAYDQALGRGSFANQSLLEQFQKNLQAGNFANQAQKDLFTQTASRGQFYNAALAQQMATKQAEFNTQNQSRSQYLTEQAALRNQPINEIAALQSGSQIQQPNFVSGGNSQLANTDVAGIINANFGQQLDIYKQQSGNVNNIIGGLFGLAGSGSKAAATAYASDRRVKKNIARVGSVYAAKRHDEPKKLPVYSYEYKNDPNGTQHIGPMAQDVEKIDPQAVTTKGGVKHIYPKRVIGDILRVA